MRSKQGVAPKARPGAPGLAVRQAAVSLLTEVIDRKRSMDLLFDAAAGDAAWRALPERDRRLTRAIVTAALRHHGQITRILATLIERPPRRAGAFFRDGDHVRSAEAGAGQ